MTDFRDTYFCLLPSDLIKEYFMKYFSFDEIFEILSKLRNIAPFNRLLSASDPINLWRNLWTRDISDYRIPQNLSFKVYYEKLDKYAELSNSKAQILEATKHGYEKLLLPFKTLGPSLGEFVLQDAAGYGYLDIVKKILNEVEYNGYYVRSVLYAAVRYNQSKIVEFLLEKTSPDSIELDVLIKDALKNNNLDIIRMLLDAGSIVDYALRVVYKYAATDRKKYLPAIDLIESYKK